MQSKITFPSDPHNVLDFLTPCLEIATSMDIYLQSVCFVFSAIMGGTLLVLFTVALVTILSHRGILDQISSDLRAIRDDYRRRVKEMQ